MFLWSIISRRRVATSRFIQFLCGPNASTWSNVKTGEQECVMRRRHYSSGVGALNRCPGTKVKSPQTNGICKRFHKTILNEFYRVVFGKKLYASLDELQADLDLWLAHYNEERRHSGRYSYGKTPMQTWRDSKPLVEEKMLERQHQSVVVHYDDQSAVA
jgi:hypothetical protein